MLLFQVFMFAFLLWKAELKAVSKKYDLILHQDSLYDYPKASILRQSPKASRKQYIPLVDGQPIFIPEEFAEPSESLELNEDSHHGLNKVKIDQTGNTDVLALHVDEVFVVDEKNNIKRKPTSKYPLNPIENNVDKNQEKETEKKDVKPEPKPTKRPKMCKVSRKSKIKKADKHFVSSTENILKEKVDSNLKVGTKNPQIASDVSQNGRNIFNKNADNVDELIDSVEHTDMDEHLTLQEEVQTMFGPSFKSFVFNPLAPTKSKFQECETSKNESGVCRYVQHCFLPSIVSSIQQFMNNVCIIESRFIGVCCPDFPVQTVLINWKDSQQSFDDKETSDSKAETPDECGVGTNTRIVGGSDANVKAWPWMVALLNNKKDFFCGGALINNRYVLTAAHCTFGLRKDEIIARVGEYDLRSDQGEDYKVVEIKRHGQYNRFTLRNDVALLKLEKPVTFSEFVKTVCFPEQTKNYTGKIATLAGWGRLQGGVSPFTSDILQEVDFPIVTNEECSSTHGLPIPDSLICTSAPSKDKSACNGDSGGPLMMLDDENRWKVVGIVSWGRRGCNTKFPSVFTRVTHYLDWIKHYAT